MSVVVVTKRINIRKLLSSVKKYMEINSQWETIRGTIRGIIRGNNGNTWSMGNNQGKQWRYMRDRRPIPVLYSSSFVNLQITENSKFLGPKEFLKAPRDDKPRSLVCPSGCLQLGIPEAGSLFPSLLCRINIADTILERSAARL